VISCPASLVIKNHQVTGKTQAFDCATLAQPKGGLHASGVGKLGRCSRSEIIQVRITSAAPTFR